MSQHGTCRLQCLCCCYVLISRLQDLLPRMSCMHVTSGPALSPFLTPRICLCRSLRFASTHDEGAGQGEHQGGWMDHADNLTFDMAVQAAEIVPEADWKQNDSAK